MYVVRALVSLYDNVAMNREMLYIFLIILL